MLVQKQSISNPRGVFLYQIGKQPKEQLGSLHKEYRTCEQERYTLEHLQWLYPNRWKEAAYFGVAIAR